MNIENVEFYSPQDQEEKATCCLATCLANWVKNTDASTEEFRVELQANSGDIVFYLTEEQADAFHYELNKSGTERTKNG